MELNPITRREMRARWRHWLPFAVVFGYAALLAVVMAYLYAVGSAQLHAAGTAPTGQRMAALGHKLFEQLALAQVLVWLLLAPCLTATAIAGERERGLLEALQLCRLAPGRIVAGKLQSALSFILLMLLVPLPITAVCFVMGGLAPLDFALVALLQAVTACTGAAIGLFFSARSRRGTQALRNALGFVVLWTTGSHALFGLVDPGSMGNLWPVSYAGLWNPVVACVVSAHPAATAMPGNPALASIAFQSALALALLLAASRGVPKRFPAPQWVDRKTWLDRLRAIVPEPAPHQADRRAPRQRWQHQAQTALWWEIPVAARLHLRNPVLQRELQGKLRLRWTNLRAMLPRLLVGGALACYYVQVLASAIYDGYARSDIWGTSAQLTLLAVCAGGAVMGAGAFAREREAGTWEGVRLSLLAPWQILIGKLAPALLTCLMYCLPLWFLMFVCATHREGSWHTEVVPYQTYSNSSSYTSLWLTSEGGTSLTQTAAVLLVIAGAACFATSLGMLCSWFCHRVVGAVTWTLGTLFFLLVFVPGMVNFTTPAATSASVPLGMMRSSIPTIEFLRLINPGMALVYVQHLGFSWYGHSTRPWAEVANPRKPDMLYGALPVSGLLFALGCAMLLCLSSSLRRDLHGGGWRRPPA